MTFTGRFVLFLALLSASTTGCSSTGAVKADKDPWMAAPALTYPTAQRGNVVDTLHGVSVGDPYRWLEDPSAPASRKWIEANNRLTFGWLDGVPTRPAIRKRLETLWNYERYSVPVCKGARCFYTKNDGLQNQSVFYVADRSADGVKWDQARVLLSLIHI